MFVLRHHVRHRRPVTGLAAHVGELRRRRLEVLRAARHQKTGHVTAHAAGLSVVTLGFQGGHRMRVIGRAPLGRLRRVTPLAQRSAAVRPFFAKHAMTDRLLHGGHALLERLRDVTAGADTHEKVHPELLGYVGRGGEQAIFELRRPTLGEPDVDAANGRATRAVQTTCGDAAGPSCPRTTRSIPLVAAAIARARASPPAT